MNESPSENERLFEQLINPLPLEFRDAGLELVSHEVKTSVIGPASWFVFMNQKSRVRLKMAVSRHGINLASLGREDGKNFNLDNYLAHHGRDEEKVALLELEKDPRGFLEYFKKILANEWKEIIEGNRWEDIPFDYKEYG